MDGVQWECADVGRAIMDVWEEVGRGVVGKGGVSEAANRAEAWLISLSTKLFHNIYILAFYRLIMVILKIEKGAHCLSVDVDIIKTIKLFYISFKYVAKYGYSIYDYKRKVFTEVEYNSSITFVRIRLICFGNLPFNFKFNERRYVVRSLFPYYVLY